MQICSRCQLPAELQRPKCNRPDCPWKSRIDEPVSPEITKILEELSPIIAERIKPKDPNEPLMCFALMVFSIEDLHGTNLAISHNVNDIKGFHMAMREYLRIADPDDEDEDV